MDGNKMKLYCIPWFDNKCYFIPAWTKGEGREEIHGWCADYRDGTPKVRKAIYGECDIAKMILIAENDVSFQQIMSDAILKSVLDICEEAAHGK